MAKEAKAQLIRKSVYSAEYALLYQRFPPENIKGGDVFTKEDVSAVVGVPVNDERLLKIIRGWVKKLWNEYRIVLRKCNECWHVPDDNGKIDLAGKHMKTAAVHCNTAATLVRTSDPAKLNDLRKKEYDNLQQQLVGYNFARTKEIIRPSLGLE